LHHHWCFELCRKLTLFQFRSVFAAKTITEHTDISHQQRFISLMILPTKTAVSYPLVQLSQSECLVVLSRLVHGLFNISRIIPSVNDHLPLTDLSSRTVG
uniref:Uncharacterized protein n=1 Tax=Echeneis naucrates TaxID=173247 RepID=A0A665XAE7_ECHNA